MLHLSIFQITQIVMITLVFILHLLTFYDLSFLWGQNMSMLETPVYGTYFVIKLGYLIAILTDGTFTPPLEVMTKLHGAVFYNVLGLITVISYFEHFRQVYASGEPKDASVYLMIAKGACATVVGGLYYSELFNA